MYSLKWHLNYIPMDFLHRQLSYLHKEFCFFSNLLCLLFFWFLFNCFSIWPYFLSIVTWCLICPFHFWRWMLRLLFLELSSFLIKYSSVINLPICIILLAYHKGLYVFSFFMCDSKHFSFRFGLFFWSVVLTENT